LGLLERFGIRKASHQPTPKSIHPSPWYNRGMSEPIKPYPPTWLRVTLIAYFILLIIGVGVEKMWTGIVPSWLQMLATFLAFPLIVITHPRPGLKAWHIALIVAAMVAIGLYVVFGQ